MTLAMVMTYLGPVGGIAGIAGGFRWFLERWERIRREERTEEDARRREDRDAAERLGGVLAQAAAAHARTAETLAELSDRLLRVEAAINAISTRNPTP